MLAWPAAVVEEDLGVLLGEKLGMSQQCPELHSEEQQGKGGLSCSALPPFGVAELDQTEVLQST